MLILARDEWLAEEVTQESFFKALNKLHQFDGRSSLYAWLCQIAKNSYYTYIKKANATISIDEPDFVELPDTAPEIDDAYIKKDEVHRIQTILHGINDPYKEVFMWRVYANLSFKQIAQIFGKTDNWACVTYHRARKMILSKLEETNNEH